MSDALIAVEVEVEVAEPESAKSLAETVALAATERTVSAVEVRLAPKIRDWQLSFGPVYGKAGTTTVIVCAPRCLFRGEKIVAADTGSVPGFGTALTALLVGQKLQMTPAARMTAMFNNRGEGTDVLMDACEAALNISVGVSFIESCTFDMEIFGKAVI